MSKRPRPCRRPRKRVVVAATVDEYMGTSAYMRKDALHRLLRESEVVTGAQLRVDPAFAEAIYRRVKNVPAVAGAALKNAMIESFRKTTGENLGIMTFFNALFSSVICFGVLSVETQGFAPFSASTCRLCSRNSRGVRPIAVRNCLTKWLAS